MIKNKKTFKKQKIGNFEVGTYRRPKPPPTPDRVKDFQASLKEIQGVSRTFKEFNNIQ